MPASGLSTHFFCAQPRATWAAGKFASFRGLFFMTVKDRILGAALGKIYWAAGEEGIGRGEIWWFPHWPVVCFRHPRIAFYAEINGPASCFQHEFYRRCLKASKKEFRSVRRKEFLERERSQTEVSMGWLLRKINRFLRLHVEKHLADLGLFYQSFEVKFWTAWPTN